MKNYSLRKREFFTGNAGFLGSYPPCAAKIRLPSGADSLILLSSRIFNEAYSRYDS
jgi:hypothetical protein